MKDKKYWVIIGKEKCGDGVWRYTSSSDYSHFSAFCMQKLFRKGAAKDLMRGILARGNSLILCKAKIGKVSNEELPEEYLHAAAFDEGDYMRNDEYSECVQIRRLNKPVAIFYCIPMYHVPNILGSMPY